MGLLFCVLGDDSRPKISFSESSESGVSSKPNGKSADSGCDSVSKPKGSLETLGVCDSGRMALRIGVDSSPHAGQGASVETSPQIVHSCTDSEQSTRLDGVA